MQRMKPRMRIVRCSCRLPIFCVSSAHAQGCVRHAMFRFVSRILFAMLLLAPCGVFAAGLPSVTATPAAGGGTQYSLNVQVLLLMTLLTVLPALFLSMTAFTRIVVVLGLLRQALGTNQTPSRSAE